MEWRDVGIVVSRRAFGEGGLLVSVLTAEHGRHSGLVRGGQGKTARGVFETGNLLLLGWKARLEEQLGLWSGELLEAHAAKVLEDGDRLAVLTALCAMVENTVPERSPHPALYDATLAFLAAMDDGDWRTAYVRWELLLLSELGFGLDLTVCASTGVSEGLSYVSPRSGRAVSAAAGEPYRDRLLMLPSFLVEDGEGSNVSDTAIRDGLALTGFFLERHILHPFGRGLPPARKRLVDRLGG